MLVVGFLCEVWVIFEGYGGLWRVRVNGSRWCKEFFLVWGVVEGKERLSFFGSFC